MEKDFLQKRIEDRAKARVSAAWELLQQAIEKSPFNNLRITIGESQAAMYSRHEHSVIGKESSTFLSHTNYAEIKERLLNQYIKEETEILLSKVDQLNYLFERAAEL